MIFSKFKHYSRKAVLTAWFALMSTLTVGHASATIVQFQTNLGDFDVNLYDQRTPNTVANFLAYVNAGDYDNSVIHRSVVDFIIQGGGLAYNMNWPLDEVTRNAAVGNEPVFSNVTATIAMAKIGGQPDSATNQWFFNLSDNSTTGAALDTQNSGFTVFGEVMANGMDIVEQISTVPTYNLGGSLTDIPLQNFSNNADPDNTNLIIVNTIIVLDPAADTAASLNPALNNSQNPVPLPTPVDSGGGGGTPGIIFLAMMFLLGFGKKYLATRVV